MRERKKIDGAGFLAALLTTAAALLAFAAPASAEAEFEIRVLSASTVAPNDDPLTPLKENKAIYALIARNAGDVPAPEELGGNAENCAAAPAPADPPADPSKCWRLSMTLPPELEPIGGSGGVFGGCEVTGQTVTCIDPGNEQQLATSTSTGNSVVITIFSATVDPNAAGKTLTASFEASGGGAVGDTTLATTRVEPEPLPFGVAEFDTQTTADPQGNPFFQAAGHPYELATQLEFPSVAEFDGEAVGDLNKGIAWPVEPPRDVVVNLPPGMVGDVTSLARCSTVELTNTVGGPTGVRPLCPPTSQVGRADVQLADGAIFNESPQVPLFNMEPPSGVAARFGFNIAGTVTMLDAKLRYGSDYGISVQARNISQALAVPSAEFTFWGVPADDSEETGHTRDRACAGKAAPADSGITCTSGAVQLPVFRLPTSCPQEPSEEGIEWTVNATSYEDPGAFRDNGEPDLSDPAWEEFSLPTHEPPNYPAAPDDLGNPHGPENCADVPVKGKLEAQTTSIETETSSGLEVHVEVPNPGLDNPSGIASSDIKRVKVSLPQGVTINPSQAEGLGVCSPAQYESTVLSFFPTPGKGCPDEAKIGTVSVRTPLLDETLPGSVYIAKPYDNPFNSLLALYIVIEEPERGILVRLPGIVRTNEQTGRIEAEFDDLPQVPFSTFDFKFREGARAPLVTPPTCGTYETVTEIEGWSDPGNPITSKSSFEIVRGIGGGPCPSGGTPGFKPGFSAGSINNNAGDYSPFVMRLTRLDGEQDMTRFSAVLPPGVLGKLAGIDKCPSSAIAIAKSKSGLEERANPSCPANSAIGRSLVGAGVGSVLTHVPGKVYLGGPFNGRPLSVIAITPAVAGPFDVGTVVVQEALTLNPTTAEVEVDGSASDPIPHMLKGIPAKLRDLRVYVDRDKFIVNPTSCDESKTDAELFGGGGNAFTTADDVPVFLQDRFQAANCAALGFKPRLGLKLKGGSTRGGFPGLQATYRPRPGDANVEGLVVRLPRSAFLEQGHIRTICTRVQFAADACPKGAQYGFIKAWTPLLDEPLAGPVYLRSSNHKLPDLVFDLHGLVDVEVATRIDSIRGGVRASVASIPDAPLSKVVLRMQGGKKGLIVNSRNLCRGTNKANVESDGHNGKVSDFNPVMRPDCGGKHRGKRR